MTRRGILTALAALWILLSPGCAGQAPGSAATDKEQEETTSAQNDATQPSSVPWELPTPQLGYKAREGRALFLHYCATCHGEEGQGNGFNAFNLDPRPRDLSDPAFQRARSDQEIEDVIRIGGGASGLSTAMPPWGHTLSPLQIDNLLAYLRQLPPRP